MYCQQKEVHLSVLKEEIKEFFSFAANTIYVDGTLGLGGHFVSYISSIPSLQVGVGIDMDTAHLQIAEEKSATLKVSKKLFFVHSEFEKMKSIVENLGYLGKITSILVDFGICSTHVDNDNRGFSFQADGPLDMRFDQTQEISAKEIINTYTEKELSDIFWLYGEERRSRQIAQAIIIERKKNPILRTSELSALVSSVVGFHEKKHPATRVFQALRIAVNRELEQIETLMKDIPEILAPGGRVAIISYHSLEDRIVKHALKKFALRCTCPSSLPRCECSGKPTMTLLTKKPITPSLSEIAMNPRSRSAKLRVAEKFTVS